MMLDRERTDQTMLIPFFVLTTIDQFNIICNTLQRHKDARFGLMITPHTVSTKTIEIISNVKHSLDLAKRLYIFSDSGAYLTNAKPCSYIDLFNFYEKYADFGAILDVLYNPHETIKSAEVAMNLYKAEQPHSFKLVGVLQGKDFDEYLNCYFKLKQFGYQNLAIGGILNKYGGNKASADKNRLNIAISIAKTLRLPWFFAFGVFSEKRYNILKHYFWGADSKRWFMSWPQRYQLFLTKLYDINSRYSRMFDILVKIFRTASSNRMRLRTVNKDLSKHFSTIRYQFANLIKNCMCLIALAENDPVLIALAKTRTLHVTMTFMQAYLDELALLQTRNKEYSVENVFAKTFLLLINNSDISKRICNDIIKSETERILTDILQCYFKDGSLSLQSLLSDLNIIDDIFKRLGLCDYLYFDKDEIEDDIANIDNEISLELKNAES